MPGGVVAIVDNISPDRRIFPDRSAAATQDLAAAYNSFEKLRDPSHGRCLGLGEWEELLARSSFTPIKSEVMDQTLEFGPWVKRMRCDERTVARLNTLLHEAPLRDFLRPRDEAGGLCFTLQEGIILAEKPR
jgi:hypothetical protein